MLVGTPATYAVQARGQEGDKVRDGFDVLGADWSEERLGERQADTGTDRWMNGWTHHHCGAVGVALCENHQEGLRRRDN